MSGRHYNCNGCGHKFCEDEFIGVDAELNELYPKCYVCEKRDTIAAQVCDVCELNAKYETADGYLCEAHYEDYLEHHPFLKD